MIKIDKSSHPSKTIYSRGKNAGEAKVDIAEKEIIEAFNQLQDDIQNRRITLDDVLTGREKLSFSDLYKTEYRDALYIAQKGKCCYCETYLNSDEVTHHHLNALNRYTDDVEHYRPKAAYKQKPNDSLVYPGYYWLAYDWDNLFYSCTACNQTKGNLFPLEDNSQRATGFNRDISYEKPLLIKPDIENPSKHIKFESDGYVKALTPKGMYSIKYYGLFSSSLKKARTDVFFPLDLLYRSWLVTKNRNFALMFIELYENRSQPNMQYSAMVKDCFEKQYQEIKATI